MLSEEELSSSLEKRVLSPAQISEAEKAMATFLDIMGCDLNDPNVEGTPRRFTKMFAEELTSGSLDGVKLTTFPTPNVGNQFVVVNDITVHSTCSHHLMPIRGVAHVGAFYFANETDSGSMTMLPGLSKYARVVEAFSRTLQLQERLTNQITETIFSKFNADWVGVFLTAEHMCMGHRGVRLHGSKTVTESFRMSERFKESPMTHDEMLSKFNNAITNR
jgi:GTP cyclohydrolase I